MAKEITKVTKEKKTTVEKKPVAKKTKTPKKVEVIDEIITDEVETEELVEAKKRKTYRELRSELRSKKNEIEVEILNLNSATTVCVDRNGVELFRLQEPGDREFITLADAFDIANKFRGNFKKHLIAIIDVDSEEYDIEDILTYLNLDEIYSESEIENYDTDYIAQIIKMDNRKFERLINDSNIELVRVIAGRAVDLYRRGKFDSRSKEQILATRLGKEDLFEM